jgi:hypothetical protein
MIMLFMEKIQFFTIFIETLNSNGYLSLFLIMNTIFFSIIRILAVHDYFKHAAGQDIFLLDWRQVLPYNVSFLNIRLVVNSVINLRVYFVTLNDHHY